MRLFINYMDIFRKKKTPKLFQFLHRQTHHSQVFW